MVVSCKQYLGPSCVAILPCLEPDCDPVVLCLGPDCDPVLLCLGPGCDAVLLCQDFDPVHTAAGCVGSHRLLLHVQVPQSIKLQ